MTINVWNENSKHYFSRNASIIAIDQLKVLHAHLDSQPKFFYFSHVYSFGCRAAVGFFHAHVGQLVRVNWLVRVLSFRLLKNQSNTCSYQFGFHQVLHFVTRRSYNHKNACSFVATIIIHWIFASTCSCHKQLLSQTLIVVNFQFHSILTLPEKIWSKRGLQLLYINW